MSDSTISLSADTTALMNSLNSVIEEISQVKDAVSTNTKAMGDSFEASARQAAQANDSIIQSTSGIGEQISEQTKVVKDFGAEQSKVAKEITKALNSQNNQQKDTNTTLTEQKKLMESQEAEIKKVTKAVEEQTSVVAKNGSKWKMVLQGFAIKLASETVDMFKKVIATGLDASRVYEDMSAKLSPLVGDIETARATFWSLNGLEDETATATDKLAQAFIDLGNNGLNNSNEQLKTYATIAHGTGKDINALTSSVIAFSQGSYKALRQFGILAKDNGDSISLTYKGVTQEIAKNSNALDEYLRDIAKNNFDGVLEEKLNTVSAAAGRLDNAWGTFCTRIMQSDGGFGELLILGNDFLANTLNGISDWLNDPAIIEWFHNVTKLTKECFEGINIGLEELGENFESILDLVGLEMEKGTNDWKIFFTHFFEFAQIGLLELSQNVGELWDNTVGVLNAIGEGIGNALSGGDFTEGYYFSRRKTEKEAEQALQIYKSTIASIEREITESEKRIVSERKRIAEKFSLNPVGEGTQNGNGMSLGGAKTSTAKDRPDVIAEKEKADELLAIESDYLSQKQILEKEAADFIRSLNPLDEELFALQENYESKLTMLEQFHEAQLISEQTYLEAKDKLLEKHNSDSLLARQSRQTEELKRMEEPYQTMQGITRNMSDAFFDLSSGMEESSSSYKALFAVQKSFAVASATMDAVRAWISALNDPTAVTWPQKLANYASAIATTTSAIGQLSSVSMYDKGGQIGAGEFGIVGEYGPELIQGPASITSRRKTADLARSAMNSGDVIINLYESQEKAGTVDSSQEDEARIINIFVSDIRRCGDMSDAIQNTFNLKRIGA